MFEDEKLRQIIAHLDSQRDILGRDAVEAASKILAQRLTALTTAKREMPKFDIQGVQPRFVGRRAELGAVKRRIEHLIQGQGRFISLIGEAGIGKSRFVAELRNQVCGDTTDAPVQWLEGSAVFGGEGASYGPFRQIVRHDAQIAERDDDNDAWHKLQVRSAVLFEEKSPEILPFLAKMMDLNVADEQIEHVRRLHGDAIRERILLAAQRLFEHIARLKPLVLVLEDLQWIDESSILLLQNSLPLIYRAPVLMLGISRLETGTSFSKLREVIGTVYHDRYDEIRLSPLSASESTKMIADLLHDEDRAVLLTDQVLEVAAGNPLIIRETIQSFLHVDYASPRSYTPEHLTRRVLAGRKAVEGERKLVTVLFASIAGFASLSEKCNSEEIDRIVKACYRIVMNEVHACEGMVNEIRGGSLTALFGAPLASEDHAQRACYACLAIQKAVNPFAKNLKFRHGIDFQLRIGLNSGPVVVTSIGDDLRTELSAQEDTIKLASGMESNARAGTILASEQTYRLAKEFFEFKSLGKLKMPGLEQSVETYRLEERAYKAKERSEREVYSEMIGRDQELSKLELQLLKAVNGEGSVINITGEAGIGKSRLLAELKRRDAANRVMFLEGRAISIGKNLSFHPIIDLLKNWAHIREDDSETTASHKLEIAIRRVCADDTHEVFPFVATIMGLKLSGKYAERMRGIVGEPLEKLIFKNVRELLLRATEIMPLVIVMEDLHWADASSLLLLEFVHRLALTQKIVFINVWRPGYEDSDGAALTHLKNSAPDLPSVEINLLPLNLEASETLIDSIVNIRELHPGVRAQIIERTGGNPFFIEEILRSFIDQGAVKAGEGGFEVTDRIHSVVIPPTIHEVLMNRIDRLDEESRNIVKIASVIGRSFFHRILADLVKRVEGLDGRLEYLKRIQLIREHMRMEELEYSFRHALAQEAAYESIPLRQRRQLHLKVAESIERIFRERLHEFYGMLAYHYSRDDNLERAEECLIKAGEEALKSAASNEALHYYKEALSVYRILRGAAADPEKIATLEKNIALALFNRGRYEEAVDHFNLALEYYWRKLPKNSLSTALRFFSSLTAFVFAVHFPRFWFKRIPTQRDAEVIDLFYKKGEALVVINPKRFFIESIFLYGNIVHFDLQKVQSGIGVFASSSALFTFTGLSLNFGRKVLNYAKPRLNSDDHKQCFIYDLLDTQHHLLKGNWGEIAESHPDEINIMIRLGEIYCAAQHYYWHGLSKIYRGHFDEGQLMVNSLSELAENYENDVYRLLKYLLNIHLLIESRNLEESIGPLNDGIDLARRNGWTQPTLTMNALAALVYLLMQQREEAGQSLERAERTRREVRAAPMQVSFLYRSQSEHYLCLLKGPSKNGLKTAPAQYRTYARTAAKSLLKICRKAALYRTDSYRLMGLYSWLIDDRKSAFKWWHRAVKEGSRLGARPQLARTFAEMAVHARFASDSKAEQYLETATAMFQEMRLHHELQDLNSAMSGEDRADF